MIQNINLMLDMHKTAQVIYKETYYLFGLALYTYKNMRFNFIWYNEQ